MPIGAVTRGTTGTNRLRRVDRWIADAAALRSSDAPLIVDLGYGANGVTTLELASRLRNRYPGARFLGLEIAQDRVDVARAQLAAVRAGATPFPADLPVEFARGGFELPTPAHERPALIRAFNVLRQYDVDEVPEAWERMRSRLADDGTLVDGTCDEIGRVSSWIALDQHGPVSLTISLALRSLELPSIVAERLPKMLIHRNVPGQPVHQLMLDLDAAWLRSAPFGVYGAKQRWLRSVEAIADAGWPIVIHRKRVGLGELTVPWTAIAPTP